METIKPFSSVTPQRSAQDMRNEALKMIQKLRQNDTPPDTAATDSSSKTQEFSATLSNFVQTVNATQQNATAAKIAYESGDGSVSLTDAVLASQTSSVAFQFLASVRNKAISAYKEIMNMPI